MLSRSDAEKSPDTARTHCCPKVILLNQSSHRYTSMQFNQRVPTCVAVLSNSTAAAAATHGLSFHSSFAAKVNLFVRGNVKAYEECDCPPAFLQDVELIGLWLGDTTISVIAGPLESSSPSVVSMNRRSFKGITNPSGTDFLSTIIPVVSLDITIVVVCIFHRGRGGVR